MLKKIHIAAGVATMLAGGAVAYAAQSGENDAMAISTATVSLTQAVATAEKHANGKAVRAEFERDSKTPLFAVEIVSGEKVYDVKIDAAKGTVLSSAEDEADREHDNDEDCDDDWSVTR